MKVYTSFQSKLRINLEFDKLVPSDAIRNGEFMWITNGGDIPQFVNRMKGILIFLLPFYFTRKIEIFHTKSEQSGLNFWNFRTIFIPEMN